MGLAVPFAVVFLVVFGFVYLYMILSCYVKRKFTDPNGWILKFFTQIMGMCESCRDACNDHKKMLTRALALSLFIAIVVAMTIHFTR